MEGLGQEGETTSERRSVNDEGELPRENCGTKTER